MTIGVTLVKIHFDVPEHDADLETVVRYWRRLRRANVSEEDLKLTFVRFGYKLKLAAQSGLIEQKELLYRRNHGGGRM